MQVYLVGGAVRDQLLNRPVTERDYVVVGATAEQLLAQGFQAVGKDFPVFLHPESKEEYALARTERKNGHGYQGFDFFASPDVSLEQDLLRRDLTVNAMAQDADGTIIDPYHGQRDLQLGILRHVSDAFREDPLRVLRVARFAAKLNFQVAEETLILMQEISQSGELSYLSAERVWKETVRALAEPNAKRFFEVLHQCGALKVWFPEVEALFGVPQRPAFHPEIDCGVHTLMTIEKACQYQFDVIVRFALLCHDLGKGLTPKEELPRHTMHEQRGVAPTIALCERLKVPAEFKTVAVKVCEHHLKSHRLFEMKASSIWKLLHQLDILRRPDHVRYFAQACLADHQGRLGFEQRPYPQYTVLSSLIEQFALYKFVIPEHLKGKAIAEYLTQKRIALITQSLQNNPIYQQKAQAEQKKATFQLQSVQQPRHNSDIDTIYQTAILDFEQHQPIQIQDESGSRYFTLEKVTHGLRITLILSKQNHRQLIVAEPIQAWLFLYLFLRHDDMDLNTVFEQMQA